MSLGYRMPAEWVPHAATWLAWPHDPLTFPDRVPQAEEAYFAIMRALSPRERVNVLMPDAETHDRVAARLVKDGIRNVVLWDEPAADVWFRDFGPSFVTRDGGNGRKELAMVKWTFNAWGNKYASLLPDNEIPYRLQPQLGLPMFEAGLVMEGGSFDVNGAGSLLTTTRCLLHENRNPKLTQADIEGALRDHLGVTNVIWLGDGIEGDDTDGHVDDVTRFVNERTIVTAVEDDVEDANHAPLAANLVTLRGAKDAQGRPFDVVTLPMPRRLDDADGERLPASYANFYIGNGVVLMPSFGGPNDDVARSVLARCFPGRNVVPIDCSDLVWGMGTLHCITQQQPAAL